MDLDLSKDIGRDIFRTKGVFIVKETRERLVIQRADFSEGFESCPAWATAQLAGAG